MKNLLALIGICFLTVLSAEKFEHFKKEVFSHQKEIHGWCTSEKAEKMMDLIYQVRPKVCVEIGVFGGSSIYPTASALKYINQGLVYAIDPWKVDDCLIGYQPDDANYMWWSMINYEEIYQHFQNMLKRFKLTDFCTTLRMTSNEALSIFADESIDILHIDGNHSEDAAYLDILMYLPKVKKGGYIWFDDVNWNTTNKAINYLERFADIVQEFSLINTCHLYKKQM